MFVNSHLLGELEMVCDRVAIMSKGTVVRQGTIRDLTERSRRYEFLCTGLPSDEGFRLALASLGATAAPPAPDGAAGIELASVEPAAAQPVVDLLRSRGVTIVSMRPVRQSLEDLFIETIRQEGDASPGAAIGKAPPTAPGKAGSN